MSKAQGEFDFSVHHPFKTMIIIRNVSCEGSCDTDDWSNVITGMNYTFKCIQIEHFKL